MKYAVKYKLASPFSISMTLLVLVEKKAMQISYRHKG